MDDMCERKPFVKFVSGEEHYSEVLSRVSDVRGQLWIGTADIKDVYVKHGSQAVPLLKVLSDLIRRGVEIRMIYAKEPLGDSVRILTDIRYCE